ncbi:hypothetical protein DCC62_07815 [candidate division KSB1 bacterium]|nr:MAG: hypothetical protein DCC62_07815 [candidate division KSB1 bacterium]
MKFLRQYSHQTGNAQPGNFFENACAGISDKRRSGILPAVSQFLTAKAAAIGQKHCGQNHF